MFLVHILVYIHRCKPEKQMAFTFSAKLAVLFPFQISCHYVEIHLIECLLI